MELDPTEDSQCVLATNGIPSEYAIRNRINVEPLPDHMLPKPGGDDTMVPDLNEEQANFADPACAIFGNNFACLHLPVGHAWECH